jgi:hypothetical protein
VQETIWTAVAHCNRGDYTAALAHYALRQPRYVTSGLPRLQVWRLLLHWGALLAHLGALAADPHGPSATTQRTAAHSRIKRIEREGVAWPLAFAAAGSATLAHLQGDAELRDARLAEAVRKADKLGYTPFALLFRRSAALFAGDDAARAASDAGLRALGVASPAAWQRTWAPGLIPDVGPAVTR